MEAIVWEWLGDKAKNLLEKLPPSGQGKGDPPSLKPKTQIKDLDLATDRGRGEEGVAGFFREKLETLSL